MDWIYQLTHRTTALTELTALTEQFLQSRRNLTLTMVCLIPHIPRLPQINIIVGGVYGVKNDIFWGAFVGEVPFPSNTSMCFNPCISGLGLPPSLHPFVVQHPHTTKRLCGSFNNYYS